MPLPSELRKAAGDLIRSRDWNALLDGVNAIETTLAASISALQASLEARLGTVETQVAALDDQLAALRSEFDTFRAEVQPILGQFYRVTLQTTKANYALGETAELTARVVSIGGPALDLSDESARPWVDFVSSWGRLAPMPGFTSSAGVGDRAIAVRVNAEGIARVRLHAEHIEGLAEEVEFEVANSLQTRVDGTNLTIAETILGANTPMEAASAYRLISREYDRPDASSVRDYVDVFYAKEIVRKPGNIRPPIRHRWRDYRATVMAFARSDSDPTTADAARGACSIQVTFRDWISPWFFLDYTVEIGPLVQSARERLRSKVVPSFEESARQIRDEIGDLVRDRGIVGKVRQYQVAREALDQLDVTEPPVFLNTLTQSMQHAVTIQQTFEQTGATPIGVPSERAAFDAIADVAVRADTGAASVRGQIQALESEVQGRVTELRQTVNQLNTEIGGLQSTVGTIDTQVGALGGRLDATLAEGGEIRRIQSSLTTVAQQVQVLRDIDPGTVRTKFVEIEGIANRLAALEGRI